MKPGSLAIWAVLVLLCGPLALPCAAEDVTNAQDHPLFPRLPGFEITRYQYHHDRVDLPSGPETAVTLEGQKTFLEYWLNDRWPPAGGPQIIRHHGNAARRLGGGVVHENLDGAGLHQGVYRLVHRGGETWAWVLPLNDGQGYRLTVLEVGQTPPREVTSRELLTALEKDGRLALYLNFDANKSDLKPEARPVIAKVAAMLQANPDLLLSVDGHTDNRGDPQRNKTLSLQRAQAVVRALVRAGVDQRRLNARGFGQEVPLTGNDDEEGRAQNQRVELVRQ